jgi:2-methylcitrate dehydratase
MMAKQERAPNEAPEPQKVEKLARWATSRKFTDIRTQDVPYLKVLVLDTIGCAIGALGHGPIESVRSLTSDLGGSELCTLISGGKTSPDHAAFFNGALVRYLDFMDISMVRGQSFHPSDNFASVLAMAEMAGASGQQLLTALATACEVQAVFAEKAPLQEKGFDHVTHLAFSIPAGCANALGLDSRTAANAIAMSACATTTLWVIRTGRLSSWKGFASAQAAMACVHMILLATRGLTGPLNLMEGPQGWEEVVGERVEVDWDKQPLGKFMETSVKRYNAEGHTQSVLECLLGMRDEHRIRAADVVRVEVDAFKQVHNIVGGGEAGDRAEVGSKEQADHSLPYLCAVALLDGDVWPEQLTDERLRRPDVQGLMGRVWVRQRDSLSLRYPKEMPAEVKVLLRGGRELRAETADYLGFAHTRRLDWDAAMAKFERLAGPNLDSTSLREIPRAVQALDSIPVSELTALLARAGRRRKVRASA